MEQLAELLKKHYDNHPDMRVRDAVKFLYQSHMGGGHLISDEGAALARLEEELSRVEGDETAPLSEPVGNGLCRLSLKSWKGKGLSSKTLCRLFVLAAEETAPDLIGLQNALDLVYTLPFPRGEIDAYLAQYRAEGCPMVSHSPEYRAAYSPAYRIISERYVSLIPLLAALDALAEAQPRVWAAIDGPCASGKSTLGALLGKIYRCPVLHMDDFFLTPDLRTAERLDKPGENVNWERFEQEVLSPLKRGGEAVYRPWICREGAYGPAVRILPAPLIIVEGSYALHPALRGYYDLRVWIEADWPLRQRRLLERGGPGCLARFEEIWIPLEDQYFQACQVKESCQLIVSGNG